MQAGFRQQAKDCWGTVHALQYCFASTPPKCADDDGDDD
eukprot:CAMPEP_0204528052 /NCGR_PEP_ID=MMETSP0661-20131031/9312_1 /ASSEMBLY_ACC=CAM_ASM_000606 /TAXON_ID=109239 /ORGANISM="Alexandrium margalefi, Strain AMGDE01CS-322" /LENGTH=38 /DNA_ID= /DNA_START= /DNA_END= /DNA_ORIENTATION=